MRIIYLMTLLSLMIGCSKSDGGGGGSQENYTMSVLSYEGMEGMEGIDDEYLYCDGTAGVSVSVYPDSNIPSRATLITDDPTDPSMVVEFNESGQPTLIAIGENYIALGNYSGKYVDISCVNSNGDALALNSVPTSVDWTNYELAIATRSDFVEGLTNDFKTIGIGVAYGLMSVGDIYTVLVDKDYSFEGLVNKGNALVGVASNLSKAVITAVPEVGNVAFFSELANGENTEQLQNALGGLSDLLGADDEPTVSGLVGSFLEGVAGQVGTYLLDKVTNEEQIGEAEAGVGEGEEYEEEQEEEEQQGDLGTSFMRIYIDAPLATLRSLSFWEPGGSYRKDTDGVYRDVGRIYYIINGGYCSSGIPEYNTSQYGAVVTYGTSWIQIYYENAPDGSYGGNYILASYYSATNNYGDCTMTVTIANDQKTYTASSVGTSTILASFMYAAGEFTYFQEQ